MAADWSVGDVHTAPGSAVEMQSWEWKEGRLLAYELILKFLLTNHVHYVFPTALVGKAQSQTANLGKVAARPKSGGRPTLITRRLSLEHHIERPPGMEATPIRSRLLPTTTSRTDPRMEAVKKSVRPKSASTMRPQSAKVGSSVSALSALRGDTPIRPRSDDRPGAAVAATEYTTKDQFDPPAFVLDDDHAFKQKSPTAPGPRRRASFRTAKIQQHIATIGAT